MAAWNVASAAVFEGSVVAGLRAEARAFADATGIAPVLELRGPLNAATTSQRIALLRAIQEASRNVMQHAGARAVAIRAHAAGRSIEAEMLDNGQGFDTERAFARARRRGRLGLSGIAARVELIGGRCEIHSRPGGPTSVRLWLPRGRPDDAQRARSV